MNKKKVEIQRLSVDLEQTIHTLIKTSAAEKNITIKKWVVRAIMKQLEREKVLE